MVFVILEINMTSGSAEKYIRGVIASPNKIHYESAIVIQGPYTEHTPTVIREFLSRSEESLIIISTTTEHENLLSHNEKRAIEDGRLVFIGVRPPTKEEDPVFWAINWQNVSLQRLTSYIGIRYAHYERDIRYTLKIRSDTFLGVPEVIPWFVKLLEQCPPSSPKTRGRIIVTGSHTVTHIFPGRFCIRDFYYFGFTSDLLKFFNMETWTTRDYPDTAPEHMLTSAWMKDLGIEAANNRELLARYFIVLDPEQVEKVWLKTMEYMRYIRQGKSYVNEVFSREHPIYCTTHAQWLLDYNMLSKRS